MEMQESSINHSPFSEVGYYWAKPMPKEDCASSGIASSTTTYTEVDVASEADSVVREYKRVEEQYNNREIKLDQYSEMAARAIIRNHLEELQHIYRKQRVCFVDTNLHTALHLAAMRGSLKCLKWLLKTSHIPVRLRNIRHETCAHLAAKYQHLKCLKLIVYSGPLKALTIACEKDQNGLTILHVASKYGHDEIVSWLVDAFGTTLSLVKNKTGQIGLHYAAARGFYNCLVPLCKVGKICVNVRDNSGATPTFYCAQERRLYCLQYLVNVAHSDIRIGTNSGATPLMVAVQMGHKEIVEFLLSKLNPSDLQHQSSDGTTVFHLAAANGHIDVLDILLNREGWHEALRLRDERGGSAAHDAAAQGHVACLQTLINAGLDIHLRDCDGQTPYDLALQCSNEECAKYAKSLTGGEVIDVTSLIMSVKSIIADETHDINNMKRSSSVEPKSKGKGLMKLFERKSSQGHKRKSSGKFDANDKREVNLVQAQSGDISIREQRVVSTAHSRLFTDKSRKFTLPYLPKEGSEQNFTHRNSEDSYDESEENIDLTQFDIGESGDLNPSGVVTALRQKFECMSAATSASNSTNNIYSEVYSSPIPKRKKSKAPLPPNQTSAKKVTHYEKRTQNTPSDNLPPTTIHENTNGNDMPIYEDEITNRNPIYATELPIETKVENFLKSQEQYCNNTENPKDKSSATKYDSQNDFEEDSGAQIYEEAYLEEIKSNNQEHLKKEEPVEENIYGTIDDDNDDDNGDQLYATTIHSELTRSESCESIHPPPDYVAPIPPPPPLPDALLISNIPRAPTPPPLPSATKSNKGKLISNPFKKSVDSQPPSSGSNRLIQRRRSSRVDEITQHIQQSTMLAPYVEQFNRARDRRPSISIQDQVHLFNKERNEKAPLKRRLSRAEKNIFSSDLLGELVKRAQERAQRVVTKEQNKPKPNYTIKGRGSDADYSDSNDEDDDNNDNDNEYNSNSNNSVVGIGQISLQEITEENTESSVGPVNQKFEEKRHALSQSLKERQKRPTEWPMPPITGQRKYKADPPSELEMYFKQKRQENKERTLKKQSELMDESLMDENQQDIIVTKM
ncbi:DgyrCDS12625 [Dimorphilus gyrociliatus]|uniref:DgyrCDS12625 n=1 Tax=Dimorphilus gyrociliatus TaxID=2664684 RepID=A0A7I8W7R3_9ANNE|nr:DgyrCDS12625 [Dimorphilus gyrociliatus]